MPITTIQVGWRPLTGLIEYRDNVFMLTQWESEDDGCPFRFQLLSFTKSNGSLATYPEVDPDAIGVGKLAAFATFDEDRALLLGDDLSLGARILDRGASLRRLEPVLIGNLLWLGYAGKLMAWNLDTGVQTVSVSGVNSSIQATYYTPLCAVGQHLLCVFERINAQSNTNDLLDYAGTVPTWFLNMIEALPNASPQNFAHWREGLAFELGLCLIDNSGNTVEELIFADSELRGYAPEGTEELIRSAGTTETDTATAGPIGGAYEGRVAWASLAAPTPPYELAPTVTATPYRSLLPALAAGETELRLVQWAEIPIADISFTTGPFVAQNEASLIWPSAYDNTNFVGIEGGRYYRSDDYTEPSYIYGTRPTGVGARVSETDPPPSASQPTIKIRQWIRRPKPLYKLEQTKPPDHSLMDVCSAGNLIIFGPRRDYQGTNFTWNVEDGFVWTAYRHDLTQAWRVEIAGMTGTRRQSRPIVAGGSVWTVIQAFDVPAQLVQISLSGAIQSRTMFASLGIPWDIETETDSFELISDGTAILFRANGKLWRVGS